MLHLDRTRVSLHDRDGRRFDAASRTWFEPVPAPADSEAIAPEAAVRWLQRESGSPLRAPIGVIGPRDAGPAQRELAETVGRGLAGLGLVVLCGGRQGVMEAVCAGVAEAGGLSIGLLPDDHWEAANPHVSVPIATGLGVARNAVIARAAICLIAIGGGFGTLSEIAYGRQFERPVFTLAGAPDVEGCKRLADWPALAAELCALVLALPPYDDNALRRHRAEQVR